MRGSWGLMSLVVFLLLFYLLRRRLQFLVVFLIFYFVKSAVSAEVYGKDPQLFYSRDCVLY
jgi:hypothetical protein